MNRYALSLCLLYSSASNFSFPSSLPFSPGSFHLSPGPPPPALFFSSIKRSPRRRTADARPEHPSRRRIARHIRRQVNCIERTNCRSFVVRRMKKQKKKKKKKEKKKKNENVAMSRGCAIAERIDFILRLYARQLRNSVFFEENSCKIDRRINLACNARRQRR